MRATNTTDNAYPRDWLLQVAANVIGVLLIVVLVTSDRVRQIVIPSLPDVPASDAALRAAIGQAGTVETDVHRLTQEISAVRAELTARKTEREALATLLASAEKELADRRARMSTASQVDYDLVRSIADAKSKLDQLDRDLAARAATTPQPESIKIESYPTPLAKPVDDKELHIQLRGKRVATVPVDELVDRLKSTARDKVHKLRESTEMSDTVGPIDGFRMRYTLARIDQAMPAGMPSGPGPGSFVQLAKWELMPVSNDLGETLEQALSDRSQLRAKLDTTNPRQSTVTMWVYPDSFDEFRALRKELYHLGYQVAGRPLPDDVLIGGSPNGTKSAAQ